LAQRQLFGEDKTGGLLLTRTVADRAAGERAVAERAVLDRVVAECLLTQVAEPELALALHALQIGKAEHLDCLLLEDHVALLPAKA
jgi:hypothetical protein